MKNKKGFTLIELLIVVAIIGIIAAIAIPNLIRALQKGKQTRTLGDMKSIGTAIESYRTECHFLPSVPGVVAVGSASGYGIGNNLTALGIIAGNQRVTKDGWGFSMCMTSSGGDVGSYSTGSGGRDGSTPTFTNSGQYITVRIEDFNNDITFSNGFYTYGPKNQ